MSKGLIVLHLKTGDDIGAEQAKELKDKVRNAVGNYDVLVLNDAVDVTVALPGTPPVTGP